MKKILWAILVLGLICFGAFMTMESCDWKIPGHEEKITLATLFVLVGIVYFVTSLVDVIRKKA